MKEWISKVSDEVKKQIAHDKFVNLYSVPNLTIKYGVNRTQVNWACKQFPANWDVALKHREEIKSSVKEVKQSKPESFRLLFSPFSYEDTQTVGTYKQSKI